MPFRTMGEARRSSESATARRQKPEAGPRPSGYQGTVLILRVGSGPQFVALVEGQGPAALRPHVGFGVEGFAPDRVVEQLAEHGAKARTVLREGAPAGILADAPDGIEIQLQDVNYGGG